MNIVIPEVFEEILKSDHELYGIVLQVSADFSGIFIHTQHYFFEEYTDHGINHINSVLEAASKICTEESISLLSSKDITILILSIFLHDIAMHVEYETFKNIIGGYYDDLLHESKLFDKKATTWKKLWEEYIININRASKQQKSKIFGDEDVVILIPNFKEKNILDGTQKKLIGEFLRRNHPRLAHEIALKGIAGSEGQIIDFAVKLDKNYRKMAGLVARSHGINIRDTYEYLNTLGGKGSWKRPYNVQIVFLMVLLRIADYFQFDSKRVNRTYLKLKSFSSPFSKTEHDKHLSVEFVSIFENDPETLYVYASPINSNLYLKLIELFTDIQRELDTSWAVLGEIYGNNKYTPKIIYRRIKSNLAEDTYLNNITFIPEEIKFKTEPGIIKLLVGPLYGYNPKFGIRELVQNAVDACREREILETKRNEFNVYNGKVKLRVNITSESYLLIEDNGKGMSLSEIKNYFLSAGSSYRNSDEWFFKYTDNNGQPKVERSGKFGIGVLSAFLIGDEIEVITKSLFDDKGYYFKAHIDTEQIEATYLDKKEVGTEIKIRLNKESVKYFSNFKENDWKMWYRSRKPLLFINDIDFKEFIGKPVPNFEATDLEWNSFSTNDFPKIDWSYKYDVGNDKCKIICNGIVIPYSRYKPKKININLPFLSIHDTKNNLKLTLDRTRIGGEAAFIEDLLIDIYKNIIAKLLTQKINFSMHTSTTDWNKDFFDHPALNYKYSFIYTSKGYTINDKFFYDKIINAKKYKNYETVTMGLSSHYDGIFPIPINENNFFYTIEHLNSYSSFYRFENFHDTQCYDFHIKEFEINSKVYLFILGLHVNDFKQIFSNMYSNNVELIMVNNEEVYFVYFSDYLLKEEFIKDSSNILEAKHLVSTYNNQTILNERNVQFKFRKGLFFSEIGFHYIYSKSLLFEKLLHKYFPDDVIIPYNLDERESLFSVAFSELKDHIKRHLIHPDNYTPNSVDYHKNDSSEDYNDIIYNYDGDDF